MPRTGQTRAMKDVYDEDEFDPLEDGTNKSAIALTDNALNYAWRFYEYHALQRVHLFRFFLVTSLAVCVGFYHVMDAGNQPIWSLVVAIIGWFIAFVFRRLDARSVEIITIVEAPLRCLEARMERSLQIPNMGLVTRTVADREHWHSFRVLIPLIIRAFKYLAVCAVVISFSNCVIAFWNPVQCAVGVVEVWWVSHAPKLSELATGLLACFGAR